ncbi:MAG: alginate export family protein [Asticcacaulis sp.]|nr:alginate export family protein [Asticcacaulis sp.]
MKPVLTATAAAAALGLAAGVLATPVLAEDTIADALSASKPILESSLRSEHVQQQGFAKEADALTWRNRFGFASGDFHNFKVLVEAETVTALVSDYNSTLNGKTAYPTVLDPNVTEINRAQITWSPTSTTTITAGRQRIILDDARFVGNVGWRQDEQTYDALRIDTTLWRVKLIGAYLGRVNRVVGDEKDWNSNSYLLNASYSVSEALKFTAFEYAYKFSTAATNPLPGDINNAKISSVTTTGLRAFGSTWVSAFKLNYVAQYAGQTPSGLNPAPHFNLHETMLEGAATYDIYSLKINYEALEGNGTQGFITPLGTVHAFEGFADAFSSVGGNKTFPNGIDDLNYTLTIAGHTKPWAPWIMNPTLTLVYHDLKTDRLGTAIGPKIGNEWDAVVTAGITKNLSLMLKYADFQRADPTMPASRTKTWIMLQYKL